MLACAPCPNGAAGDALAWHPWPLHAAQTLKRLPPQVVPPRGSRKPPKIVLPTDRLYRIRNARDKGGERNMPFFAHGELQSSTMLFAQRQWVLMRAGKSEEEAYEAVKAGLGEAKEATLAAVKALTVEAQAEGATVPGLLKAAAAAARGGGGGAGADPLEQLAAWRQKLADVPYGDWELGQQVMLDHWIGKACLGWGWEQERYLHAADFEEAMDELRGSLFPETLEAVAEEGEGEEEGAGVPSEALDELETLVEGANWDNPELADMINEWCGWERGRGPLPAMRPR